MKRGQGLTMINKTIFGIMLILQAAVLGDIALYHCVVEEPISLLTACKMISLVFICIVLMVCIARRKNGARNG